jgi:hypothetical protein
MSEKGGVLAGKEVVDVVGKEGGGISIAAVEHRYGAKQSTIRFIRKKER